MVSHWRTNPSKEGFSRKRREIFDNPSLRFYIDDMLKKLAKENGGNTNEISAECFED